MITIEESGMTFGPFVESSFYRIEESRFLPENVKPVEFIWCSPKGSLCFVEAKSSFSRPENVKNFKRNIQDICSKFIDSLTVMLATKLGRQPGMQQELPADIENLDWANTKVKFILVLPNFQTSWLIPIKEKLEIEMKHIRKAFGFRQTEIDVLNPSLASKLKLATSQ